MKNIDISRLSKQERLDLIGELCDSLEAEDIPVSEALKAELDRRNPSLDVNRAQAVPWSEVQFKSSSRVRLMLPVYFLPAAETKLREAQEWYDARAIGLGERFFAVRG